jgi:hypothetical protein
MKSLLMGTGHEGSKKATGGGEWEPIKIPRSNLAYVPNRTWRPSLLTLSRPHSYQEAIVLETGLGDTTEIQKGASKTTSEIDDKNQIKEQFIFSQAFH